MLGGIINHMGYGPVVGLHNLVQHLPSDLEVCVLLLCVGNRMADQFKAEGTSAGLRVGHSICCAACQYLLPDSHEYTMAGWKSKDGFAFSTVTLPSRQYVLLQRLLLLKTSSQFKIQFINHFSIYLQRVRCCQAVRLMPTSKLQQ